MECYQYTADGYYFSTDDDYGLLPNNATYVAPNFKDGFIPRWTGDAWELIENHKERQGYVNGEPFVVHEYGPLPEGWSDEPPEVDSMATRRDEIYARLAEIDLASVRPLRAVTTGEATEFDQQRLAELDREASDLRAELATLND